MGALELTPHFIAKTSSNLQIVVIDSLYDAVNQDPAIEWLGKLFRFKVNSYREFYPYGISPFGDYDLIGTHWILCRKNGTDLAPLMSFKTTDSARTDIFRMEFPALAMVNGPNSRPHRAAIEYELKKAQSSGYGLGFLGGWTIDSALRKDPLMSKLCRKISAAFYTQWVNTFNIQAAVTFAISRFHVEKFHAYLGMTRLMGVDGEHLCDFAPPPTFGELASVSVLYRQNHSKAAIKDSHDLMELWEDRIVISSERSPLWKEKAQKRVA